MIRSLALLVLFSLAAGALAPAKNESSVSVADTQDKFHRQFVKKCTGTIAPDADLAKVSLSKALLQSGVECLADDFDNNGYLDILFFAPPVKGAKREGLVVFFEKSKVLRTQVLPYPDSLRPFPLDDRERKNYPKYIKHYGLIIYAEGDAGHVFFLSPKSGLFEEVPYVYPKNYEMN